MAVHSISGVKEHDHIAIKERQSLAWAERTSGSWFGGESSLGLLGRTGKVGTHYEKPS